MLYKKTSSILVALASKLWDHKAIVLSLSILAYRLFKVHQNNKKWDDHITARFNEELIEDQIRSCLEFELEYFKGGEGVEYNEEDMKILATLLMRIPEFENINTVMMRETHLSDQGVSYLADITRLQCLRIGFNDISDEGLRIIGKKCVNLVDLDISGNDITTLEPLYNLGKLAILNARQTKIKDCDDLWLQNSGIETVDFAMTAIEASRLEAIEEKLRDKNQKKLTSTSTTADFEDSGEKQNKSEKILKD